MLQGTHSENVAPIMFRIKLYVFTCSVYHTGTNGASSSTCPIMHADADNKRHKFVHTVPALQCSTFHTLCVMC